MNEKAKEKFLEIRDLFRRMSHEVCVVVESYYIWRTLTFARSIPEVGQEQAEKNAKLMALYKDFFIPTEQSHLQVFIIGLMKFFDKHPQALSIAALIKIIQENKGIFTADVLQLVYPDLAAIDAIKDDYSPITQDVVDHVEQLWEKHKGLIDSLKDVRDKQFAHTDTKTIKGTFVPNEVEALIEAVQEMFNKLSGCFDLSFTIWDHLKEDSVRSTQFMLENLERGEVLQMAEIKKKWG
ncbi:MAG: hypothetical protein Q7S74_04460 [Nanoarchaeota archaeon]|nr:hypothetical protein [Nanoarchaeota archaeon]